MLIYRYLKPIIVSLGFVLASISMVYAENLPVTTTSGGESDASMTGTLTVNGQEINNGQSTFSTDDQITVEADIIPDFQQLIPNLNDLMPNLNDIMPGLNGQIPNLNEIVGDVDVPVYIVVSFNSQYYVKNNEGEWIPWQPGEALPPAEVRNLSGNAENIEVVTGLNGLAGNFEVYVGYGLPSGEIVHNKIPLSFSVEPDLSTPTS